MSDNVTLAPGTGGATLATDDIGGVQFQRIKLIHGVDGINDGDVSRISPLPVDIYQLISPKTAQAVSVAIAAGSSADLDSNQITSAKVGKLVSILPAATVPIKVELKTVLNGVASGTLATIFRNAFESIPWNLPSKEFYTVAEDATAGFDGFRLTITNLDQTQAADLYATFLWDEV